MYKLFFVVGVAASTERRALLADGDPLALQMTYWTPTVLELCEEVSFEGDFRSRDYLWPRASESCVDDPTVALCYLARRLSGLSDCTDAAQNYKMCSSFPDAMTNYCCEAASDLPGCAGAAREPAGTVGGQSGVQREDAPVNAQSARPFLPGDESGAARRLLSSSIDYETKNLLIIFPDQLTTCSIINSLWRMSKMASLMIDLDSLTGMMDDADMLLNNKRWMEKKIAAKIQRMIDDGGYEKLNSILDGSAPIPEGKKPLVVPSTSLKEMDQPRRFIDQFGSSQPFIPPTTPPPPPISKRRLHECASLPSLIAQVATAATEYFSGELEPGEFTQQFKTLLDEYVVVIDGKQAGITKDSLSRIRGMGIATASFALVPACSGLNIDPKALQNAEPDVVALSRLLLKATTQVRDAVFACDHCLEKLWIKVVQATSEGQVNEAAAAEEATNLRKALHHFNTNMEDYLATMTTQNAPTSLGNVAELALNLLSESVAEIGSDISAAVEAALLFFDALQREPVGGGFIQDAVREFSEDYLKCPLAVKQRSFGAMTRKLQEEEAVAPAAAAVEAAARAMQQKKRQQIPYEAVAIGANYRRSQETLNDTTIPPVAGRGNLLSRQEVNNGVPIVGYQCRDSLPTLFSDYFSLWLERGTCADLIETFGCFSQNGRVNDLLPFPILLHACPESWNMQCRPRVSTTALMSQVRAMIGDEDDLGPDDDDDDDLDWERDTDFDLADDDNQMSIFFAQLPEVGAFAPFRRCLASSARRIGEEGDDEGQLEAQQHNSTEAPAEKKPQAASASSSKPSVPLWLISLALVLIL